jgi:hypothetical protein
MCLHFWLVTLPTYKKQNLLTSYESSKCSHFVPEHTRVVLDFRTDVVGFFNTYFPKRGPSYNSTFCF